MYVLKNETTPGMKNKILTFWRKWECYWIDYTHFLIYQISFYCKKTILVLNASGIQYALKPNATYVVGRAAVDINCPTDQSVSEIWERKYDIFFYDFLFNLGQ